MAARKTHKDVEYGVGSHYYRRFDEAAGAAVAVALSSGFAELDVLIYSESGARFYGGDAAVEQYREDPEASVFERIEIKGNMLGRIP